MLRFVSALPMSSLPRLDAVELVLIVVEAGLYGEH